MGKEFSARTSITRHIFVGLCVIGLLFAGVGGWAAATPLSGAVIAVGSVVVDSNTKPVQHLAGGIVAEILVNDGSYVEEGAVLVRLDATETRANLSIIENRLDELQAREARLIAERNDHDVPDFAVLLADRNENPKLLELISTELWWFEARRSTLDGQIAQLEERIIQFGNELEGLSAQVDGKDREIDLIKSELAGLHSLLANGNVALTRVNALERDLARLEAERGAQVAAAASVEGQIAEARLQILQLRSERQTQIAQETVDVRTELDELAERQISVLDQLRRVEIRSPQRGIVHGMTIFANEAVIAAGIPIMHIVPVDDALTVEVSVAPQDIDQLHLGQTASLRFSAFNQQTTPEIKGTLSRVGADLTFDEATGMSYYIVRVETSDEEIAKLGHLRLLPGMPVEAFIETEQRTALSYLVKPLADHVARAFREE